VKALGFWISNIGFRVIINHKNIKKVSVRAHTYHFVHTHVISRSLRREILKISPA